MALKDYPCVPCSGSEPPLFMDEIKQLLTQVPGWEVHEENGVKRIEKVYTFPNFKLALNFSNLIGQAAEKENHHPSLLTEWGKVKVTWWTHKIKGLHRNDFVMAARTDDLYDTGQNT